MMRRYGTRGGGGDAVTSHEQGLLMKSQEVAGCCGTADVEVGVANKAMKKEGKGTCR